MTPAISVVIATKDRAPFLERALGSLELQASAPPFEVVVADNGSSDDTHAVVQRARARASFPVEYLYEERPNRARARNRAIAVARGSVIVFCDDDVQMPAEWLRSHWNAHGGATARIVNGPILNVTSYDDKPKPTLANFSRASLCTCNASISRKSLETAGGFDESFDLYGWEDSELGIRLRDAGVEWKFAWNAPIWHVKPPAYNTLDVELRKAVEKARMARHFVEKHPSKRARMATGAHGLNLVRAKYLLPDAFLAALAGIATHDRLPGWMKSLARAQLLDATYARELVRSLR
ncbi:MAG: glycosyltransferase [Candidatus Eremiobacteraeota bacterium]|nr:glycosyltransferase [Candidatus Eremiobacteraeota bacterium]